MRFIVTRNYTF